MTGHADRNLRCDEADELAGALALDALDPTELEAMRSHLATCDQPHAELRALAGAPLALASTLEPMVPDPALRARVMRSVSSPEQAGRAMPDAQPIAEGADRGRRSWFDWASPGVWRGVAAVAGVVVLLVGIWNLSLQGQIAARDAALSAVAEAISGGAPAYPVSGPAGSGYVIDTSGPGSTFLVAGLESLPGDELYEMWLLDADGTPLAVGTIDESDAELVVATLEQDLTGFATFAVTVETEPVDTPSGDPVMLGPITN
jgi:anti-sigma-K factor RskA